MDTDTRTPPIVERHGRQAFSRRIGACALLGGGLQVLGLALEWLLHPQAPDAQVTAPAIFAGSAVTWLAGVVLLIAALASTPSLHRKARRPLPRSGRVGAVLVSAGYGSLTVSGLAVLLTGLATGRPAEWSFLFFAAGYLLALGGTIPLAIGLRQARLVGLAWSAPLVAGLGIAVAIAVERDPWHDLGLVVVNLAWMAYGLGVALPNRRAAG